jgi:hypothetical protein
MARQLLDAEQLRPQWRFARAWARTLMCRPPVLNAQWQCLHVVLIPQDDTREPRQKIWGVVLSLCMAVILCCFGK